MEMFRTFSSLHLRLPGLLTPLLGILMGRKFLFVCTPNLSLSVAALPMHCCKGPDSISSAPLPADTGGCCCVPEAVPSPGGTSPLPTASPYRSGAPALTIMVASPTSSWFIQVFPELRVPKLNTCALAASLPDQGRTFHLSPLTLIWLLMVSSSSLSWPLWVASLLSKASPGTQIWWHL